MIKKELAKDLLSLLDEGKTDELQKLCETFDFCHNQVANDRVRNMPACGYTKKVGDIAVRGGELAKEALKYLRNNDLSALRTVLEQHAA